MENCYTWCVQHNARYITLSTGVENSKAQRLYEKMGMEKDTAMYHYNKYW
ncbi:MAG: GNAT family N-acetyltransferase [Bacilli bacterium]